MHKCPQEQSPMVTIHKVGKTEEKIPADTEFLGGSENAVEMGSEGEGEARTIQRHFI